MIFNSNKKFFIYVLCDDLPKNGTQGGLIDLSFS